MHVRIKSLFSGNRLNLILKIAVALGLGTTIWLALGTPEKTAPLYQAFRLQCCSANFLWLLATLFLMPFNCLIETQKWRPLLWQYEPIAYSTALKAVLAGFTLAIFSPNRLGEYAGRVLFIAPNNQGKAFMAHVLGGISQFVVLVVLGSIGALWGLKYVWPIDDWLYYWAIIAAATSNGAMLLVYFNFLTLIPRARQIAWLRPIKRYVKDVAVLEHFSRAELWQTLGWSALRYGISCVQYYFLLQFFGLQTGILNSLACIAAIFLIQTFVPLPPVASFFVRGNVAIWVWGLFGLNALSSLATTMLLWIINLFLPALIGTFFIFHVNITKAIGYENE